MVVIVFGLGGYFLWLAYKTSGHIIFVVSLVPWAILTSMTVIAIVREEYSALEDEDCHDNSVV